MSDRQVQELLAALGAALARAHGLTRDDLELRA